MGERSRNRDQPPRGDAAGRLRFAPYSLDPASNTAPWKQLLVILGDGLVGFKRVGGTDGESLVPDLAVSLPAPTDGGRAYRFVLRRGIRYSNGDVVAPADFRRGIEREFALKSISAPPAPTSSGGSWGASAGTPDTCDLSEGSRPMTMPARSRSTSWSPTPVSSTSLPALGLPRAGIDPR